MKKRSDKKAKKAARIQAKAAEAAKKAAAEMKALTEKVASIIWYHGPDFHLVHRVKNRLLKQASLTKTDLTPGVLRHAEHLVREHLKAGTKPEPLDEVTVTPVSKRSRDSPKAKGPPDYTKGPLVVPLPPPPPEKYAGPAPEERSGEGRQVLETVTRDEKPPFLPGDAKFKTLYRWAEKVRDYYEIRGKFASLTFLQQAVEGAFKFLSPRATKAKERLALIYPTDARTRDAKYARMEQVMRTKPVAEEGAKDGKAKGPKGKDKWGYRLGTRAARVNAVIIDKARSEKKIRRLAEETNTVHSHLSSLLRKKLIVRTKSRKYRLRRT